MQKRGFELKGTDETELTFGTHSAKITACRATYWEYNYMFKVLLVLFPIIVVPLEAKAMDCVSSKGLAVDADGAPDSYRVDGKGLSFTCDGVFAVVNGVAQTQKNNKAHWQELCRTAWASAASSGDYSHVKIVGFAKDKKGHPIVQGKDDPLPGKAFVTTTSLTVPNTPTDTQRHYVNANEIPYVVLSSAFAQTHHLRSGDIVAMYRPSTNKLAFAVYGDCCDLGEGSVRLHQDLGNDPIKVESDGTRRAKRGLSDTVFHVALTGVHTHPTVDASAWRQEIEKKGKLGLDKLGGLAAVNACVAGRHG